MSALLRYDDLIYGKQCSLTSILGNSCRQSSQTSAITSFTLLIITKTKYLMVMKPRRQLRLAPDGDPPPPYIYPTPHHPKSPRTSSRSTATRLVITPPASARREFNTSPEHSYISQLYRYNMTLFIDELYAAYNHRYLFVWEYAGTS